MYEFRKHPGIKYSAKQIFKICFAEYFNAQKKEPEWG